MIPLMSGDSTCNAGFRAPCDEPESLYERFLWLYAFCRDHLFRDDTKKIVASLWSTGDPSDGDSLLELGCGPRFYGRRLAARFGNLHVTGIDGSERQLHRARGRVRARRPTACKTAPSRRGTRSRSPGRRPRSTP
jgi:arsenite methyltransferase